MKKIDQFLAKKPLVNIIKVLNKIFSKLPHLPLKISKFFAAVAPWLALLSAIVGVIAGPIMGLLGLLSLVTLKPLIILSYVTSAIIMILNTILMFKAFKPLRKKEIRGWIYLFWSNVLWLIDGMIEVITGDQGVIALVISNLISFYILFEMKRGMGQKVEKKTPQTKASVQTAQ